MSSIIIISIPPTQKEILYMINVVQLYIAGEEDFFVGEIFYQNFLNLRLFAKCINVPSEKKINKFFFQR